MIYFYIFIKHEAAICAFLFLMYEVFTLIFLGEIWSSMSVVLFLFLDIFFKSMLFKLSIFTSSMSLMLESLLESIVFRSSVSKYPASLNQSSDFLCAFFSTPLNF